MPEDRQNTRAQGSQSYAAVPETTERLRDEDFIRRSELCLSLATESAGLGIFQWSPKTDAVLWENDRIYEIFGRGPSDGPISVSEYIQSFAHPDDVEGFLRSINEGKRTGQFSYSGRFTRTDGELRWIEIIGRLRPATDGSSEQIWGIVADVTDRKTAQIESQMLAAIVASSDDAIISKDLRGVITSWNQAAERIFGYTAAEIIGRHILVLTPPGYDDDVIQILSKIQRGERVDHFETKRRTKDGRILDLSITVSPIRNSEGEIIGASKVARDVTERNLSQKALRESEEQLRQITDVLPQQVWTARADGGCDYLNAQIREYLGDAAVKDGVIPWSEVVHPDDYARSLGVWNRSVSTGVPYEIEQRIRHGASGEYRWHLCLARPVRDATGRILKWFGTNTDIDDRKRWEAAEREARDAAESANRIKDEFLATLSHELRTPLSSILGWAKILRSGRIGEAHLNEGLAVIERNSIAQVQIIEDLLDVSRIVSGKFRLELQNIRVQTVIEAAVTSLEPTATAKDVRIHKTLDSQAGTVSGDPSRLQQVVWNLLANALKFTPKGGQVHILLEQIDAHLEIRIVDTGIGMSPEFLPHVFDRFRQADSSTTRRHGGLGLGLAIVKQLVELHGGSVRADSPGEGRGSTFVVSLPIMVSNDVASVAAPSNASETSRAAILEGIRVLVLDDDSDARRMIDHVLTSHHAQVAPAATVREALELVESFKPDAIVSDIGIPQEDGYDFIRKVRAHHSPKELPAAALTAFARAEDRKIAMLAGFQTHVVKPVDPDELIAVVASLVGRTKTG